MFPNGKLNLFPLPQDKILFVNGDKVIIIMLNYFEETLIFLEENAQRGEKDDLSIHEGFEIILSSRMAKNLCHLL